MAIQTEQIIWSDLHPDLKIDAQGRVSLVTNVKAVYASIENILLTIMGERCMLRSFAVNFRGMLFEPIKEEILRTDFIDSFKKAIETWEPRVKISYLDFTSNKDEQTVYIRMELYIRGYDQVFTYDKEYRI